MWYKITFSTNQIVQKKHFVLAEAFEKLFMQLRGPKNMALFSTEDLGKQEHYYFMSPACKIYCTSLIKAFKATATKKPSNKFKIALIVGHADARKMLK